MSIDLGRFNTLRVIKEVPFGVYLDGDDDGEILLPSRYVPEGCRIGDELKVFIYLDNEERLIATTQLPRVQVGGFAYLNVNWVNQYGAFLDWGLMKDLFVPFSEQKERMEPGKSYVIHAHVDPESFRIVGSAKVARYIAKENPPYKPGDEVYTLIWQRTPLGYKAIVDNEFGGLIYADEVFQPLAIGDMVKAYVRQVRPDGKIDLTLQPDGTAKVNNFAPQLLHYIQQHGGRIPFGDKTPAEEIYAQFRVSKKTFKKAIGDLYKRRLIRLEENEIMLND